MDRGTLLARGAAPLWLALVACVFWGPLTVARAAQDVALPAEEQLPAAAPEVPPTDRPDNPTGEAAPETVEGPVPDAAAGADTWSDDGTTAREGNPGAPQPPQPPPPAVELPAVWDAAKLLLVTSLVGLAGAGAGFVASGLAAAAVATGAAVLVRGWRLGPAASGAGIFTFLFVPPLLLLGGTVAGYVLGRLAAPWLASLVVGGGVAGWRARWGGLFMALDAAGHLAAGVFLLVTLGTTALVCGALAAVSQTISVGLSGPPPPRGSQLGLVTGMLFSAAMAVFVLPLVLVLLGGGVPVGALALGAWTWPQEAP